MPVWKTNSDKRAGFLYSLSDAISVIEKKHPDILNSVSDGAMIVASDYSGQHKGATHEAYSFLITTSSALEEWLPSLSEFRQTKLPDNRRFSYKKLNESVRWNALTDFLTIANALRGNLITIMVDRRISTFLEGGYGEMFSCFPNCFPANTKKGTVEKMYRLASFMALIMAGMRSEDQESYWISDHDETLDSHEKREGFRRLSSYITFGLTGWRTPAAAWFETTESQTTPYWSEDIAALADIVAGAYCQLSEHLPKFLDTENWTKEVSSLDVADPRARKVGNWLSSSGALKHLLLRLEPDESGDIRCSAQAFAKQKVVVFL